MSEIIKNAFEKIDPRNEQFVTKNIDIVEEIYALMEQKGISSQKELAKLLNKQESEISKFLSGLQNLTLRSITNLEVALGQDIIMTPSRAKSKFERISYFVCYKKPVKNDYSEKIVPLDVFEFDEPQMFELKLA